MLISIDKDVANTDLKLVEIKNHTTPLISLDEQKNLIDDKTIKIY